MAYKSPAEKIGGFVLASVILLGVLAGIFLNTSVAQAAVIFTRFLAIPGDTQVLVQWTTSSEINTNGFYVVSSSSEGGVYTRVSGYFPRQGSGISGASYEFIHSGLVNGTQVFYKLEIITNDLTSIFTGSISATPNPPTPTPTLTVTPTPSLTFTPTVSLTPTSTASLTPSLTITGSISPTLSKTSTLTLTSTLSLTPSTVPSQTFTRIPSATRRPPTAIPTRTLVRIQSMTPTRTPTNWTPVGTQPTNAGGGYPAETDTRGTSPVGTGTPFTATPPGGGGSYPGGEGEGTPAGTQTSGEGTENPTGQFQTQGTPVPFRTATPTALPGENTPSGTWGWVIGVLAGLSLLGGGAWYYFRIYRSPVKIAEDVFPEDLFHDDPEE